MEFEVVYFMCFSVVSFYEKGKFCGLQVNVVKYLGVEVGFKVCMQVVMMYGGMGYVKEFVVECLLCEIMIVCIVLVSLQLIFCNVVEKVLGLFKSYQ